MPPSPEPPHDTLQIRCARLGHQIPFSYCRTENFGLPCARIIICWHPYFAVAAYLRRELTAEEWRKTFARPAPPKVLTLVELIAQAQNAGKKEGEGG